MKRKAYIIKSSSNGRKHICIDEENADEILAYINADDRHRKKFNYVTDLILQGLRNHELYDKEEPNDKCKGKGVYGMKFFKRQENDRLYCKQFSRSDGQFFVITSELFRKKKSEGLTKQQVGILEKIAAYEYEIVEEGEKKIDDEEDEEE